VKPVAPAGEFVEGALFVASADVAIPKRSCTDVVEIVEGLMIEVDAETVMVEVLRCPVDVDMLEEGLVEGLAQVVGDGL